MGLIANLAFYNQLNINDLRTKLFQGDSSGLAAVANSTPVTISSLRAIAQQTSPYDLLRVLAPDKASQTAALLRRIVALAEYVQSLCGYLAANEELEPIHSVICNTLRTGADFERALNSNPIHLAAGSIKHLCSTPDVDGVLQKKPNPTRQTARRTDPRRWPLGICHAFQRGECTRPVCRFAHECGKCRSERHGALACTSPAAKSRGKSTANV